MSTQADCLAEMRTSVDELIAVLTRSRASGE
jgi:hypothetical protein